MNNPNATQDTAPSTFGYSTHLQFQEQTFIDRLCAKRIFCGIELSRMQQCARDPTSWAFFSFQATRERLIESPLT